jgi:hypothetical protein
MDYPPKALCTGFDVKGIATIDANSYGVFLQHMGGDLGPK